MKINRPATAFPMSAGLHKRPHIADKAHLRFIRGLPCLVCGSPGEAAHVRYGSVQHGKVETGTGRKPDDRWCVPLCASHHRTGSDAQHNAAEGPWWVQQGIDPLTIAALLYSASKADDREAAEHICNAARQIVGLVNVETDR